jgi:hypothetical protein
VTHRIASKRQSDDHKRFLGAIAHWRHSYEAASVSFVAVRAADKLEVIQARIVFAVARTLMRPPKRFESTNILPPGADSYFFFSFGGAVGCSAGAASAGCGAADGAGAWACDG